MPTDFSGEYVLNRAASMLSPGADAIQSGTVRIEHREPVFRLRATFVAGGRTIEYAFERLTDGREVASGEQESSRLYWDGVALVSEDRTADGDSARTLSWRYELLDQGRRLRAIEQIEERGQHQQNIWEFARHP